ncbi:MAG: hypothetical protein M1819_001675 [Sarea resinae]|nr:MAG: hypothetical protein M1819_001675 [Sarea resinae]
MFLAIFNPLVALTAPLYTTRMADSASSPPSISVDLAIDPPSFIPGGSDPLPSLSITATSHATQPITIFTWPTVFNLDLSQKRANFTCLDLTSDAPLRLELTKGPKRTAFNREKGGSDDVFFQTLEPETPTTFKAPFKLACRTTEGRDAIVPGHRYRFGVREGEQVPWWRYGSKEDVMAPAGEWAGLGDPSGGPLALGDVAPVEFEVKQ